MPVAVGVHICVRALLYATKWLSVKSSSEVAYYWQNNCDTNREFGVFSSIPCPEILWHPSRHALRIMYMRTGLFSTFKTVLVCN
jgi:hypothetical protein